MKNLKKYAAWTKKAESNEQYVTTVLACKSKKEYVEYQKKEGRIIDGKVYLYN